MLCRLYVELWRSAVWGFCLQLRVSNLPRNETGATAKFKIYRHRIASRVHFKKFEWVLKPPSSFHKYFGLNAQLIKLVGCLVPVPQLLWDYSEGWSKYEVRLFEFCQGKKVAKYHVNVLISKFT